MLKLQVDFDERVRGEQVTCQGSCIDAAFEFAISLWPGSWDFHNTRLIQCLAAKRGAV